MMTRRDLYGLSAEMGRALGLPHFPAPQCVQEIATDEHLNLVETDAVVTATGEYISHVEPVKYPGSPQIIFYVFTCDVYDEQHQYTVGGAGELPMFASHLDFYSWLCDQIGEQKQS